GVLMPSPQMIVAFASGQLNPLTTLPVNDWPSTAETSTPAAAPATAANISKSAAPSTQPTASRRNARRRVTFGRVI
ncbi:MAG: hypothetical protein ABI355_16460, partial [Solirubrobacteraceae bacterium]